MADFDPYEYNFQLQQQERSRFEKLTKEEQDQELLARQIAAGKEAARNRSREGWRKWRGR